MTYTELGRQADNSQTTIRRAEAYIRQNPDLAGKVKVMIPGANFGDGSQDFANALTEVVKLRWPDLAGEAMALLESRSEEARARLVTQITQAPDAAPQGTSSRSRSRASAR